MEKVQWLIQNVIINELNTYKQNLMEEKILYTIVKTKINKPFPTKTPQNLAWTWKEMPKSI